MFDAICGEQVQYQWTANDADQQILNQREITNAITDELLLYLYHREGEGKDTE